MTDDLFPRLRRMWERRDPVPVGLAEAVLVTLGTVDLDYELLTLVESAGVLAGVRGGAETMTLTFGGADTTVMLRVSPLANGRRRVDGWVSPAAAMTVRLSVGDPDGVAPVFSTRSSPEGRFELEDVPAGPARMWLEPRLATGPFEL